MVPDRVADASVIGALVFGESRADEAWKLLKGKNLHAPSLLPYELASIARRKIGLHPLERDNLLVSLGNALSLPIRRVEPDFRQTSLLAMERGLNFYDAAYVWTARALGIPLLSFDDRLRSQPESRSR